MALLLGLDFGTGGLRLGVFDLSSRRMLGEREEAYATAYPHPGWAEQSPADWWQALGWVRDGLLAGGMLREVEVTGGMPKKRPWISR